MATLPTAAETTSRAAAAASRATIQTRRRLLRRLPLPILFRQQKPRSLRFTPSLLSLLPLLPLLLRCCVPESTQKAWYLSELHEDVHHAHEVSPLESGAGGRPRHELLVQRRLPSAEAAHYHVLVLARQLLLNVLFVAIGSVLPLLRWCRWCRQHRRRSVEADSSYKYTHIETPGGKRQHQYCSTFVWRLRCMYIVAHIAQV